MKTKDHIIRECLPPSLPSANRLLRSFQCRTERRKRSFFPRCTILYNQQQSRRSALSLSNWKLHLISSLSTISLSSPFFNFLKIYLFFYLSNLLLFPVFLFQFTLPLSTFFSIFFCNYIIFLPLSFLFLFSFLFSSLLSLFSLSSLSSPFHFSFSPLQISSLLANKCHEPHDHVVHNAPIVYYLYDPNC